jgi:hypothetical protein
MYCNKRLNAAHESWAARMLIYMDCDDLIIHQAPRVSVTRGPMSWVLIVMGPDTPIGKIATAA